MHAEGAVKSANAAKSVSDISLAAPKSVTWKELVTATVTATMAQMASGAPSFVTPTIVSQPSFSSTFAPAVSQVASGAPLLVTPTMSQANSSSTSTPAADAMSGQPPAPVQRVNGTTQGPGAAVVMFGRIVKFFRGRRFGYIRSEGGDEFFFGWAEYKPRMSVGDQVQFTYDPNRVRQGTCPMAVDIWYGYVPEGAVYSKGGRTAGAQSAAMAPTDSWSLPKRTYSGVAKSGRVGSSALKMATKLGASAKVVNGVVKNDVDKRFDSMQSALERLGKDNAELKEMLGSMQRQRAILPS